MLYPSLARHKAARAIVLEGSQEHHVADVLLKELRRMPKSDERWGAKFRVLQESIEHLDTRPSSCLGGARPCEAVRSLQVRRQ